MDGKPYNAGLFHSGAGFGDDEFFRLCRRVAQVILAAVRRGQPNEGKSLGIAGEEPVAGV